MAVAQAGEAPSHAVSAPLEALAGLWEPLERDGRKGVVGQALSQMPAPLTNQQIVLYANTRRIDTDGIQAWPEHQRRRDWPCWRSPRRLRSK
jgi:hypothetical protein